MLVGDILDSLTFGELSQLSIGGSDLGEINYKSYPQLINAINVGVLEIHKRFSLKLKSFQLQHLLGTTKYNLSTDHAVTDPAVATKYILDTVDNPFSNDILALLSATDELGTPYGLNDTNADNLYTFSIFTYDRESLVIPFDLQQTTNIIDFTYRATPTRLVADNVVPETSVIDLPDQFLEPLLNYVAYRMFAGINSNSPDSISYYGKFEASIKMIERIEGYGKQAGNSDRLNANGWV